MASILDQLDRDYPVRNTIEQKKRFCAYAAQLAEEAGDKAREEDNEGHGNLVIGDPDQSDAVFTAHYDTPRRSVFPNIMLPTNRVLHFLYVFATVFPLVLLSFLAGQLCIQFLDARLSGGLSDFGTRLTLLISYLVVYFGLYLILFRGPANRTNKRGL